MGEWLLESFCSYDFLNTALWDLEEIYQKNIRKKGKLRADLIYIRQAFEVIYHLYLKGKSHHSSNRTAMLNNNLKISLRSLLKNKSYTLLNLLGLVSGLVVFILITVYTTYEFSFDNYHEKGDRIVRIYKSDNGNFYQGTNKYAVVPAPLAPTLKEEFPQIEFATRMSRDYNTVVEVNDQVFVEDNVFSADQDVFDIFSFEYVSGNPDTYLSELRSAVISESTSLKFFGRTDVVGETIRCWERYDFQVSGVIKDMPKNSHFVIDVLLNFEGLMIARKRRTDNWNNSSHYAFVSLVEGTDLGQLQNRIPEIRAKYADDPIDEDGQESDYYLQPISEMHFTKDVNFDIAPSADAQSLYIYIGIAFMILTIAGINYVNLATARALNRTKEIGIRKVIGAQKSTLIKQYLIESALLVYVSLAISIVVLTGLLPAFSSFIDKQVTIDFQSFEFWLSILFLGAAMTLLSGIYPALMLAKFKPTLALKGSVKAGGKSMFRNILVIFQFTISCALILGASVLANQLNYIQNMDSGYVRDQIVVLDIDDREIRAEMKVLKEAIKTIPGVSMVSISNSLPNNISSNTNATWPGRPEDLRIPLYTNVVDFDYVDLFELEIVEGRNFDPEIDKQQKALLLNESAVKALGWEEPIGRQMMTWFGDTARVVGILKDFHQHSVHLEIEPTQFFLREQSGWVSVKLEGENSDEVLASLEAKYEEFDPLYPFTYYFFQDIFDRAYRSEMRTAELANWFTGLAILIACLGLYGLAAHKVQNRIKEVGVRKVLGASVSRILLLLSKDFALLLLIAFAIAAPIAYFVMDGWLDGFAYHVEINIMTFFLALLAMLLVAGLTVGYRTYRAAVRNPVEALRDE